MGGVSYEGWDLGSLWLRKPQEKETETDVDVPGLVGKNTLVNMASWKIRPNWDFRFTNIIELDWLVVEPYPSEKWRGSSVGKIDSHMEK